MLGCIRRSKDFKNIIHPSLLDFPDEKLVLDALPSIELHLLLGVVNHFFKNLCDLWPGAKKWEVSLHIPIQHFHGDHFNGNDCLKFLKGLDCLEQISEQGNFNLTFDFIKTFSLFKDVVTSCFRNTLDPDYESKIANFKKSYITVPMTVTLEAHPAFHHVPEFLKAKNFGLRLFSEQLTKALHSNFKTHWGRYRRNLDPADYSEHLLSCTIAYTSKKV